MKKKKWNKADWHKLYFEIIFDGMVETAGWEWALGIARLLEDALGKEAEHHILDYRAQSKNSAPKLDSFSLDPSSLSFPFPRPPPGLIWGQVALLFASCLPQKSWNSVLPFIISLSKYQSESPNIFPIHSSFRIVFINFGTGQDKKVWRFNHKPREWCSRVLAEFPSWDTEITLSRADILSSVEQQLIKQIGGV